MNIIGRNRKLIENINSLYVKKNGTLSKDAVEAFSVQD